MELQKSLISLDDKLDLLATGVSAGDGIITVDTEGSDIWLGTSICFTGLMDGIYIPQGHFKGNLSETQKEKFFALLDKANAHVYHNAAHDLRFMKKHGYDYRGAFYDTMLMAHWINEDLISYALDKVSVLYGGKPKLMPPAMERIISSDGWDAVPLALMDEYSGNDAFITHQLFNKLLPQFQAQEFDKGLWATEQKFIRDVIIPMKDLGIKIDVEFSMKEYYRGMGIMKDCETELGFKPSSPKGLKNLLIDELHLPVVKHTKSCKECYPANRHLAKKANTHSGPPSFDKDAMAIYESILEKKDDDRAKTILTYRGWQKTTGSNYRAYMNLVDDDHILHPNFNLHRTRTGRLSCSEPNLQQIPKSSDKDWNGNLKKAFIARPGRKLWTIDYSQLQFRMTCSYANCKRLIDIFNDPTRDIFEEMASQMGWLRQDVKVLVYLILFGGGATRASVAFDVSVEQGGSLVNEFHSMYPEIKEISREAANAARKQGYVTTWTGRRRHFPRNRAGIPYYKAFNAVIQGGESDIMKKAMLAITEQVCDDSCSLLLQIHDELAFEIEEGKEGLYLPKAQTLMEEVPKEFCQYTEVPVIFKTSMSAWGEK